MPLAASGEARHVRRLYTTSELVAEERCLPCGGPARASYSLDFAAGSSTLDLTGAVPDVPMCGECLAAHGEAMRAGLKPLVVALVVPPVLVVALSAWAPGSTPLLLPIAALGALAVARFVIALVVRHRASRARVLYLDGAGDDVLLQIRLREAREPLPSARGGAYRSAAQDNDARFADGDVTRPRAPRVKTALGFLASVVTTALATLVGFYGAYPFLVIDNPGDARIATVDGRRVALVTGGRVVMQVGHGDHRVAFPEVAYDLHAGFGNALLVSADPDQCYDVAYRATSTSPAGDRHARGPIVGIEDPSRATRERCPSVRYFP